MELRRRGIRKRWILVQSRVDLVARHAGAARGVAADRAGLRHLLRARGGDQRRADRAGQGRDRRSDRAGHRGRARPAYGVTGNFVIDPAWREPDFERLWGFVERHRLFQAGFTILTPLPGTAYFEEMRPRLQGAAMGAVRHAPPALGAGARPAAVLRAVLRDVAPVGAEPARPQERVAVAAPGRSAQRDVPACARWGARSA